MTRKAVRSLGTALLVAAVVLPGVSGFAMYFFKPARARLIGAFVLWDAVPLACAGVAAWFIAEKRMDRNFVAKAYGVWFGAAVVVLLTGYLFIAVWIPLLWQPRLTWGAEASIKLLPVLEMFLYGSAYVLGYLVGRAAGRQGA
jgi:uncharacterized membrane protein YidH (DUF202 family)